MLTQDRLKELLDYDPETGVFVWKVDKGTALKGTHAGTNSLGYVVIQIDKKIYGAHRLAWLYAHGYLSENDIDHIDRFPSHNWISNLREVSHQCNLRNCGNPKNNKSGIKGVCWSSCRRKWVAQIVVARKTIPLGRYDTKLEAAKARLKAEQDNNWSGCDSSSPAYKYVMEHTV